MVWNILNRLYSDFEFNVIHFERNAQSGFVSGAKYGLVEVRERDESDYCYVTVHNEKFKTIFGNYFEYVKENEDKNVKVIICGGPELDDEVILDPVLIELTDALRTAIGYMIHDDSKRRRVLDTFKRYDTIHGVTEDNFWLREYTQMSKWVFRTLYSQWFLEEPYDDFDCYEENERIRKLFI